MGWFVWLLLEPLIGLFSFSDEESGKRHLFQCTSAAFGGRGIPWKGKADVVSLNEHGNGLFLVNYKCECTPNAKVMAVLRKKAREVIWYHTLEVLGPYLKERTFPSSLTREPQEGLTLTAQGTFTHVHVTMSASSSKLLP